MKNDYSHIQSLDAELVAIIQDFLILRPLSWPKETMTHFLNEYQKGNLTLPKTEYPTIDYSEKITALTTYIKKLKHDDCPVVTFLEATAKSYLQAYRILQNVGTTEVNTHSKALYGSPTDILTGYTRSNLDIAEFFIRVVDDYHCTLDDPPEKYNAAQFKKCIENKIKETFPAKLITVHIDNNISARATAGSNYIKIRKDARFSDHDLAQLFHHEVMIHTLTYINGHNQPTLKTLGYNAPRTTATQEGLAVFAEYINSSIELNRLKRIALRIKAIHMAENGADFIDLFQFFQQHGQNAEESYYSSMRIFRGGVAKGGVIFYKDNVYLRGLIEVSSFLKQAMHQGFIHDIALLFCGKITTDDVLQLKPVAEQGVIIDPVYMPDWAKYSSELAAHMAINDLTERFKIEDSKCN